MKITKTHMQQLIKEEIENLIKEQATGMEPKSPKHTGKVHKPPPTRRPGPMKNAVKGPMRSPSRIDRLVQYVKQARPGPFRNLSQHFAKTLAFGELFNVVLAALLLTGDSEEEAVKGAIPYVREDPDPGNLLTPAGTVAGPEQILHKANAAVADYKQKLAHQSKEGPSISRDTR